MPVDFLCQRSTPGPRQTHLEERWRCTDCIFILESKRWNGGQSTALCPNESTCKYCRGCLAPTRWFALVWWIDDCWEWAEIGTHFLCHLGSRPDFTGNGWKWFHVEEVSCSCKGCHIMPHLDRWTIWIHLCHSASWTNTAWKSRCSCTHIQSESWNSSFIISL